MSGYKPTGVKKIFHQGRRFLAEKWLSQFHPVQIGITGSQGKTGTTEIVYRVLSRFGPTIRTDVNLDTTFNVPITALKVRPWTKFVVWELGIDHPGEMDLHHEIAHPSISCVTGISAVHTDAEHMGSIETLVKEKRRIIEHLPIKGTAVLNHDNPYTRSMAHHTKASVKWFGTTRECTMWTDPRSIELTLEGTRGICYVKSGNTFHALKFQTGLIGAFHIYNIMNAYLIVQAALPRSDFTELFLEELRNIKPLPGRMSVEKGPMQTILLNDSLRASPGSTKAGLESFNALAFQGRKIAVIGEMGELEHPEKEHRETGKYISTLSLDRILCIGPLRKFTIDEAIKSGVPKDKLFYAKDVFEASELLKHMLQKGDLWYLKGSLLRNYGRILKLLRGEPVCCHEVLCPYEHCS